MKRLLLWVALALANPALAQVEIRKPWTRATPPGAVVAGGYMVIVNRGVAADRLLDASSPAAGRVETHVHEMQGEVATMRRVSGYEVPAGGSFELRPGGAHLMFMDIRRPFREGERVAVRLRFRNAGEVNVEFAVAAMGASGHGTPAPKH